MKQFIRNFLQKHFDPVDLFGFGFISARIRKDCYPDNIF
jgi:hypothetical protein